MLSRRDQAKLDVERAHAKLSNEIRDDEVAKTAVRARRSKDKDDPPPPPKLTEAAINAMIASDGSYQEAQNSLTDANAALASAQVLQDAWRQRGFALRDLVELYTAQYYERGSVTAQPRSRDGAYDRAREGMHEARERKREERRRND